MLVLKITIPNAAKRTVAITKQTTIRPCPSSARRIHNGTHRLCQSYDALRLRVIRPFRIDHPLCDPVPPLAVMSLHGRGKLDGQALQELLVRPLFWLRLLSWRIKIEIIIYSCLIDDIRLNNYVV